MTQSMTEYRRTHRGAPPVDPHTFAQDIEAALAAFAEDVSYAVAMARAAVTITRKREAWQARREARVAEQQAQVSSRSWSTGSAVAA